MPKPLAQSFVKALCAGIAAGLAGSLAKAAAEKIFPPRPEGATSPPEQLVERAQDATGTSLPEGAKDVAAHGMHWAFGAIAGGLYSVVAEYRPGATSWRGAVFGLTVNKLMHDGLLPRTGFVAPKEQQPFQERASEWVSHAVYGIATESARRSIRKRL
jgi:putative membrane protein